MKLDTVCWWAPSARLTLLLAGLILSALASATPTETLLVAFKRDVKVISSGDSEDRADQIRRAFLHHFGATPADAQSSTELLKARLYGLATVAHHAPDEGLAKEAAALASILHGRQAADHREINYVHRMLLAQRDFDGASYWSKRFPEVQLTTVPKVERMSAPQRHNAYAVSADGSRLLELPLDMHAYSGVLILGHPACGFSREAAAWMRTIAPERRPSMVRWLTPVDGDLQLPLITDWNASHQDQALLIARHERDWPFVQVWDTPQFFIFSNGTLQLHLDGWNERTQQALTRWLDLQGQATLDEQIRDEGKQSG